MNPATQGLVLLVHGSRDESWLEPFAGLVPELAAAVPAAVFGLATLQFAGRSLEEAVEELAPKGAREILIVPFFLSARGHVLKDVPGQVEQARQRYPGIKIETTAALGEQPEVKAAIKACLVRLAQGQESS